MSVDNRNLFGDSVGVLGKPRTMPREPASNVVPFGKYKGQPIEVMAADAGYVEWLAGQAWFRDKYENIYTLIINNFAEPSETPAHNALQVLFLDDDYARRVVEHAEDKRIWKMRIIGTTVQNVIFEDMAVDVVIKTRSQVKWADRLLIDPRAGRYIEKAVLISSTPFEYVVELKPVVGDDYPAVLRQMRNLRAPICRGRILFLEQYTGSGATKEQFVETFRRSGIVVVFRSEV